MAEKLMQLDIALDRESWQFISDDDPGIASAVEQAVGEGVSPDEIYSRTLQRVGEHRKALAMRCKCAARYLQHQRSQAAR